MSELFYNGVMNMATSSSPSPEYPRVIIDADARPLLTVEMSKVRDGLLKVVRHQMDGSNILVEGIRVSLKRNLEEDWSELVFRIQVDADSKQALAFWDSVGNAIAEWRQTLSKRVQKLLDEKVGVFVEWE